RSANNIGCLSPDKGSPRAILAGRAAGTQAGSAAPPRRDASASVWCGPAGGKPGFSLDLGQSSGKLIEILMIEAPLPGSRYMQGSAMSVTPHDPSSPAPGAAK